MDQAQFVPNEMVCLTTEEARKLIQRLQVERISLDYILREYVVWLVLQTCQAIRNKQTGQYEYHLRYNPTVQQAIRFLETRNLVRVLPEVDAELICVPVLPEHQLSSVRDDHIPNQSSPQLENIDLRTWIQEYIQEYDTILEVLQEYVLPILLQSCSAERTETGKIIYSTDAITAYADAARLLQKFGFVKVLDEVSHRWVLFEVLDPNTSSLS